jgi:hypothetical protein
MRRTKWGRIRMGVVLWNIWTRYSAGHTGRIVGVAGIRIESVWGGDYVRN